MIRTSSIRRRTRTAVGAAGLALAAAALTACGTQPAHQGAAAVVGGQRISIAAVDARVAEVRDGVAAAQGQNGGARNERAGLARKTVSDLVLDRVIAQALTDHGLSVTDTEIADGRSADAKALGGETQLARELLLRQAVPSGGIDAFYRQQLGIQKLAAAQGEDPRTDAGNAAIRKALVAAGTELDIQVNPRYGHWDVQQIGLADTVDSWLPQNTNPA
ncbi:SurA N-terminal domain-containing protein [Kitasatospora sp. NPDC048365]|uniref:SurA N-terminal domain-containing protein n=1 Tax=Kitasatospora sp. NPDC048365 TaxID=3364050 RepID=UPI00371F6039